MYLLVWRSSGREDNLETADLERNINKETNKNPTLWTPWGQETCL